MERDGETEEIKPTPPYRSFACVTDCRALLIVGQEPENWDGAVRFGELDDFGLKPGPDDPQKAENVDITTIFSPILRLRIESTRYSFVDETSLALQDVISLGELIKSNFSEDRWEYEAYWESAERVRKKKQQEATERKRRQLEQELERQREQEECEKMDRLRKEVAERKRRERLETLAEKSSSTSVTAERLEPIFANLYEGETVDFILWGGQRGVALYSPDGAEELVDVDTQNWTAITIDRILFSTDSGVNQIQYEVLRTARVARFSRLPVDDGESTQDPPALIVSGGEFVYTFEASGFTFPHLHDLADAVRKRISESQ